MKRNLKSIIGLLCLLWVAPLLAGSEKVFCDKPKGIITKTNPISFQSTTPTPAIPSTLTVGDLTSYTYTILNNSPYIIQVEPLITPIEPSPVGDVTIDSVDSTCVSGTTAGFGSCLIIIDIDPSVIGSASYTLSLNYTVGGDQSCFEDISTTISYDAVPQVFAYIVNSTASTVSYCPQGADGQIGLSGCGVAASGVDFSVPVGIAIPSDTFTGDSYAYITNSVGYNNVVQCLLDPGNGPFTSCADSGAGAVFNAPAGITFETISTSLYAYVTNSGSGFVSQCLTSSADGTLSTCVDSVSSFFDNPKGIQHQTFGGSVHYVYIANYLSNNVMQCTINASGLLVNCVDSGVGTTFNSPVQIGFYEATNWYGYVSNFSDNTVSQCSVNASTGQFSSCADSGATGLSSPEGVTFATIDTTDYAYVTNSGDNSMATCTIDPGPGAGEGNLTCSNSSTQFSTEAATLVEQTFAGTDYVYIMDPNNSKISQCKIYSPTGQIYCIDSGMGSSFFTSPTDITFFQNPVTSNIFAYVTDSGANEVWLCNVNQTSGQLTSCSNSGPIGFYNPYDIVIPPFPATYASTDHYYAYITDTNYNTVVVCEVDYQGIITGTNNALCNCRDAYDSIATQPYTAPTALWFEKIDLGGSNVFNLLYVGDPGTNKVYSCPVSLDDTVLSAAGLIIGGCNDPTIPTPYPMGSPAQITFEEVTGGTIYTYVTDQSSTSVVQCTLSQTLGSAGNFVDCTDLTVPNNPLGITFDTVAGTFYAYLSTTPLSDVSMYRCPLDISDGSLGTCVAPYGNPSSVAFETPSGTGFTVGYVAQNGGSGLASCQMSDADGTVLGCIDSGAGFIFSSPVDVVFQTVSSTLFAYVVDEGNDVVYRCQWNSTSGIISTCVASTTTFDTPAGITFDTTGGTLYAYVTDASDNVYQCDVSTTPGPTLGVIGSCVPTGSAFNMPLSIAFNNDYAYVADNAIDMVLLCEVNSSTGILSECVDSGATSLSAPSTIIFQADTEGTPVIHAYITNTDVSDSVTYCDVNPTTGVLSGCIDSGVGAYFDLPYGIVFQYFGMTPYAYVTNSNNTGGGLNHSVSQCTLNTDGTFDSCVDSGANPAFFDTPLGILFFPSLMSPP